MLHRKIAAFTVFIVTVLIAGTAPAQTTLEEEIRQRLTPAGSVCVEGQQCAAGVAASAGDGGGDRGPEQIYTTYCQACHETGVNDSPVRGDAAVWQPRLDKGMETLYQNAINGFADGAMPARGLCTDCSDEEVRATVDYLLAPVQGE